MFDIFWVLLGVVVLGGGLFGLRFPLCVCVCVWLGAFGVSTGEKKNILTNVKECRESTLRSGFNPRQVHVGCVVDKVAMEQVFSPYLQLHCQ